MRKEIKAVKNPDWQGIAEELWHLLDNIDTASDAFKTDRKGLADFTYKEQQKRHALMTSNGYELFPLKPMSVDGTCCACGYMGKEEKICPERSKNAGENDSCCDCWWNGPSEEEE